MDQTTKTIETSSMSGLDFKIKEMAGRIRALREIEGLEPSQMAAKTGVSTEEYEDFYFKACLVDYDKMGRAMKPLEELMNRTDKVHIVGPGTDITFSIKGIGSFGMHGNRNIPDGEIYTAPVKDSINGYINWNSSICKYQYIDKYNNGNDN